MPEPSTPSLIFGDTLVGGGPDHFFPNQGGGSSNGGMARGTDDAMPRFGGRTEPGETVTVVVDGELSTDVTADENGLWSFTSPEVDNGEHSYEMWSENAAGERSDSLEWDSEVFAGEADRIKQRERNDEWRGSGEQGWKDQNSGLTSTPVSAGGGGGGTQGGGGGGTPGSGGTDAPGVHPKTPLEGFEKGNAPGG